MLKMQWFISALYSTSVDILSFKISSTVEYVKMSCLPAIRAAESKVFKSHIYLTAHPLQQNPFFSSQFSLFSFPFPILVFFAEVRDIINQTAGEKKMIKQCHFLEKQLHLYDVCAFVLFPGTFSHITRFS